MIVCAMNLEEPKASAFGQVRASSQCYQWLLQLTHFKVQTKRVHAETKDAVHMNVTSWHAICLKNENET
jgi:hypothetical protein